MVGLGGLEPPTSPLSGHLMLWVGLWVGKSLQTQEHPTLDSQNPVSGWFRNWGDRPDYGHSGKSSAHRFTTVRSLETAAHLSRFTCVMLARADPRVDTAWFQTAAELAIWDDSRSRGTEASRLGLPPFHFPRRPRPLRRIHETASVA